MKNSRKVLFGNFLVLIIVAGCLLASFWQFSRLSERKQLNSKIEKSMSASSVSIPEELLDGPSKQQISSFEYRPVEVTGKYLESSEVLVAGRTFEGQPGFNVLTAMETKSNSAIVYINRGWIPQNVGDAIIDEKVSSSEIAPEGGYEVERTIVGLVRKNETKRLLTNASVNEETKVSTLISSKVFQPVLNEDIKNEVVDFWIQENFALIDGEKVAKSTAEKEIFPKQIPNPELSERNHLSYAIQWLMFAIIALITWIVILKKQRKATSK